MTLIDLSHPVEHGVGTYPGFPTPSMAHHISYEQSRGQVVEGRQFCIDLVTLAGGTGTYMDAPRHFDEHGDDIAAVPLHRIVDIPATVVPAPADGRREYRPADFAGLPLHGRAVLLATGWDTRWATPAYLTGSPFLGPEAAHLLVAQGAALVGIDAILLDDIDDLPIPVREAHASLLGAGIPIVENLTGITQLVATEALVTAVPAPIRGVGSFPVRAYALLRTP